MLYADIQIDLASEHVLRRRTLLDWLAGIVGREVDLRTGEEVATASGLSVFKAVTEALAQVGITDVLSVIVDDKTAFVDTTEDSGDLETAVSELDARAALERGFTTMNLVMMHRAEGLRTLVDIRLARRVEAGTPELVARVATRRDAMQITRGEGPATYAERLRGLAQSPAELEAARARVTTLTENTREALRRSLGELAVSTTCSPTRLRLIRPGPRALDHFRRLSWGSGVRMPDYRPIPVLTRVGAYDEPFSHHYFDPYFDFASYVTLVEVVEGRGWQGLEFEVVEADASVAFTHQNASSQAPAAAGVELGQGETLVDIGESTVSVHDAVPRFEGLNPGEVQNPATTPGYGGSERNVLEDRGWAEAGSSVGEVSGGDFGGSCGSSCGGCGA